MNIWELIIQQPLTNILIVMSHYLGGSFGAAIVILTIVINLILLPMTLSQIRSSKKMQDIQPKMAELQKKYAKDKQKLAEEQMKLYKTAGIKPVGCMLSMFIQMPVWIALYQSIMLALAASPEGLLGLARYLYPWNVVYNTLPLSQDFLGMNLAASNWVLAILVGVAMWVQQKMSTTPSTDPRTQQQNQMMLWMMPMLFTFMALSFNAGLAVYWVTSSLFRIILQYRISGWGGLIKQPAPVSNETKKLEFKDVTPRKPAEEESKTQSVIKEDNKNQGGLLNMFRKKNGGDNKK